ncbi:RHS repeat-associated core domain protein [Rothia aeria F0474]|uniref:RHS repeat-associated core domain protein n=1 Tax=Rothia aeria F0474 TaxID=1125724 RepID=I0UQM8_9MICC|nr:RHS repeat-associated core domain protein [Rothia aeria F0474]
MDSPVLFAGQYEDQESGWVYNRFRFYDPAGGVYGAQDPLGVGPNVGTAQGYVANPLTWVDALGLKALMLSETPQTICNKKLLG